MIKEGRCYSHDGRVRQRIYAILTTVMCYSHSTDGATSAKKYKLENARFFTRTEIGTDSGRPEPVPVQR